MATMTNEKKEYVKSVAAEIWEQLLVTTGKFVVGSWGIEQIGYTLFGTEQQFPALTFIVNGLRFKGRIFIALDEGIDYYQIHCLKDGKIIPIAKDICFDEMGEIIDEYVERGTCSQEEYSRKVDAELRKSFAS